MAAGSGIDLTGRTVVVTGAGSGIGRAVARTMARAGAGVLGVGRRIDALRETAETVRADATRAETVRGEPVRAETALGMEILAADLRDGDAAQRVIGTAVDRWGRLDIVINNAGATRMMSLADTTVEGVSDLFALNVTAPSLLARAGLPHLRRTKGSIVNVSSTYGHRPLPGAAHYAASKAALEQLTRSWAVELAPDRIRVNAVAPGPTESDALLAAGLTDAQVEEIKRTEAASIPLGRRGSPEEVADWILRLADPGSGWLTGQVLTVDGGLELV